jgi:hypothetical protein
MNNAGQNIWMEQVLKMFAGHMIKNDYLIMILGKKEKKVAVLVVKNYLISDLGRHCRCSPSSALVLLTTGVSLPSDTQLVLG